MSSIILHIETRSRGASSVTGGTRRCQTPAASVIDDNDGIKSTLVFQRKYLTLLWIEWHSDLQHVHIFNNKMSHQRFAFLSSCADPRETSYNLNELQFEMKFPLDMSWESKIFHRFTPN